MKRFIYDVLEVLRERAGLILHGKELSFTLHFVLTLMLESIVTKM